jgi:hypothetical protein
VPPFLSTIDDPRAAHGGSLKGCGVCGGIDVLHALCSNTHNYYQVSDMEFRTARSWRTLNEGNWPLIEAGTMEGGTENRSYFNVVISIDICVLSMMRLSVWELAVTRTMRYYYMTSESQIAIENLWQVLFSRIPRV